MNQQPLNSAQPGCEALSALPSRAHAHLPADGQWMVQVRVDRRAYVGSWSAGWQRLDARPGAVVKLARDETVRLVEKRVLRWEWDR